MYVCARLITCGASAINRAKTAWNMICAAESIAGSPESRPSTKLVIIPATALPSTGSNAISAANQARSTVPLATTTAASVAMPPPKRVMAAPARKRAPLSMSRPGPSTASAGPRSDRRAIPAINTSMAPARPTRPLMMPSQLMAPRSAIGATSMLRPIARPARAAVPATFADMRLMATTRIPMMAAMVIAPFRILSTGMSPRTLSASVRAPRATPTEMPSAAASFGMSLMVPTRMARDAVSAPIPLAIVPKSIAANFSMVLTKALIETAMMKIAMAFLTAFCGLNLFIAAISPDIMIMMAATPDRPLPMLP